MNIKRAAPLLSICVQVFNRHETLMVLLEDLPSCSQYEVVVYDFSTDKEILSKNRAELALLHHIVYRECINEGLDYGFDILAKNSVGKYCWLLPDDDLVASNNISLIMAILESEAPDFLLLNSDVWTSDHKTVIRDSMHNIDNEIEHIDINNFDKVAQTLSYVGACIFKTDQWIKYSSPSFYNSYFMHVFIFGKILSQGGRTLVTNLKGSHIRANNALWTRQAFIIWTQKWPAALHSIECIPNPVKDSIALSPAHNNLKYVLYYYAYGALSEKKAIQSMFTLRYKIFYIVLRAIPRKLVSYLVFFVIIVKNRKLVSEPAYYLLSSLDSRISAWLLKRYF
jgi:hypothetical protein